MEKSDFKGLEVKSTPQDNFKSQKLYDTLMAGMFCNIFPDLTFSKTI